MSGRLCLRSLCPGIMSGGILSVHRREEIEITDKILERRPELKEHPT